jgi:hypothetical protein
MGAQRMSSSKKPLRYRGLSRERTERVARVLGVVSPLVFAALGGALLAVGRRFRYGGFYADLPLGLVVLIGAAIGAGVWLYLRRSRDS